MHQGASQQQRARGVPPRAPRVVLPAVLQHATVSRLQGLQAPAVQQAAAAMVVLVAAVQLQVQAVGLGVGVSVSFTRSGGWQSCAHVVLRKGRPIYQCGLELQV